MWKLICENPKKFVAFQSDTIKTDDFAQCRVDAVGRSYYDTMIVSGIVKGFEKKELLDRGYKINYYYFILFIIAIFSTH